ncbi:uncharacterized protein LOC124260389 [Haliotis rubra]|uniref:uncharacterized protein LOC124260389 n=1 Tax=Haliotis rubra TaxID=36100 RepID=UPI001EE605EC|nr:uncharacterized protein LOC124260389 [Haliotis rubra]
MAVLMLCWLLLTLVGVSASPTKQEIESSIRVMRDLVENAQVKKDKKYVPLLEWAEDKGVWPSYVKQYFHGVPDLALFRQLFGVFDNNMFATAYVMEILAEFSKYGDMTDYNLAGLNAGLVAIKDHRDKNLAFNNSLMTFWPQVYNETLKTWDSSPRNLVDLIEATKYLPLNWTYAELEKLGLKDIEYIMVRLMRSRDGYMSVFHVPPDFDDTFLNIGLGSMLKEMSHTFPEASDLWMSQNPNLTSVFDALKRYAYRPLSGDQRVNTIDSRSYVYLRKWLAREKLAGNDVALVTTWIQDTDEVRTWFAKGVMMPFNVNNVDVTVSANFMYAVTAGIISGVLEPSLLDDTDILHIYNDTTRMLAFQIQTNFSDRVDLALTYYPPVIEFYWFVARTYNKLQETLDRTGSLPHKGMDQVLKDFKQVLRTYASPWILDQRKSESQSGLDTVYYDDFIGDGDITYEHKSVNNAEDRIFTSSMALNALLTIWATEDQHTGQIIWDKDTPSLVQDTVQKIVTWLYLNSYGGSYKPWNAFFSGSNKGATTSPAMYPVNRIEMFNGTKIPINDKCKIKRGPEPYIFGVEGTIPEETYDNMTSECRSPVVFHGYNDQDRYFPFWTSDAYTYVTVITGMAKYVRTLPE